MTIVGNRPQLIKLDKTFETTLIYTGQHYDKTLKDVFFKGLHIRKPDYDLKETELGKMIDRLSLIIKREKPDFIIVYGDTRTTLAGAMVALYENIKLIHIEAGCRSYNDKMIEERIRKIVDQIAIIHFAPTQTCKERLEAEGHLDVYNVGATQIDAMYNNAFPTKKPKNAYKYNVLTIHREGNMKNIKTLLTALGKTKKNIKFFCHPRTKKLIDFKLPKNIKMLNPVPYKKMISEIAFADKIITDSGGLQVEAFFLRRPCVTLRDETEWPETVEQGWNKLVGADEQKIIEAVDQELVRGSGDMYVFGGGDSNKKIRLILESL